MKPFEITNKKDELKNANGEIIGILPVPTDEMLEGLRIQTVNGSGMERLSVITNIEEDETEEDEGWQFSEIPADVTRLTVERIMHELAGEGWFGFNKEDGYSISDIIELLSERTFVQLSELTLANIRACLGSGGKVIAYFPDLVWREYFGQLPTLPSEVLGMRVVEIAEIDNNDEITVNDLSDADGEGKRIDKGSFEWLSKDGWMLEVYK
ncbi:MAG: hypothetical protein LUE20_05170 [Oscillospiraceae bacterium]|nr:hypothetical protein [Oscillospiraceae bacterium]